MILMDKKIKAIRINLEAHKGQYLSTAMLLKYVTDIVQNQVIVSVILQSQ